MSSLSLQARSILQLSESLSDAEHAEVVRMMVFRLHMYSEKTTSLMNSGEEVIMQMCKRAGVLSVPAETMARWRNYDKTKPGTHVIYHATANELHVQPWGLYGWAYEIVDSDDTIRGYPTWEEFWRSVCMDYHPPYHTFHLIINGERVCSNTQ